MVQSLIMIRARLSCSRLPALSLSLALSSLLPLIPAIPLSAPAAADYRRTVRRV